MSHAKRYGQFFTPPNVAQTLVRWAVRHPRDRILDPSCGDGEFLACRSHAVGIELDAVHAADARRRAPSALVHEADFFVWAASTHERFEAAVGNPPFIRYQGFTGAVRDRALAVAARIGARIPRLTSSWAPFIASTVSLLKPGGRLAFVVPAEIGHASYSIPFLRALCDHFDCVRVVAVREKIFPELSEDTWLLYASGRGGKTSAIEFSMLDRFAPSATPPDPICAVSLTAWERAHGHLRRWLLPAKVLSVYETLKNNELTYRLGEAATVGIGYVTGANDFFHLRPSLAKALRIPRSFLQIAVRRGDSLPPTPVLTREHVRQWIKADEPVLLLDLAGRDEMPEGVSHYLQCREGASARQSYKCRVREPWFAVPDVKIPDGFLTYMSGERVGLVRNAARCVATNSVHVVSLKNGQSFNEIQTAWSHPLVALSCELEGHPLGGGMLKVEPREAQRILLPRPSFRSNRSLESVLHSGIETMRRWRHYA